MIVFSVYTVHPLDVYLMTLLSPDLRIIAAAFKLHFVRYSAQKKCKMSV